MIFPQSVSHEPNTSYAKYLGKELGNWTIKSLVKIKNRFHFIVQCNCGSLSRPISYSVVHGYTKSCKYCAPKKHGLYKTPTNMSWSSAKNRCNNPNNKDFVHYGGRGIKMCVRWERFENFLEDMGEKPKGLTLDRVDNNGNYEPGNCRWATYSQQNRNQRRRCKGAQS